jgi:hypothetical protein
MRDFEIVAIVLALFFGFGIAMGVLIIMAFPRRRRRSQYLDSGGWEDPPAPPEDNERPPWYDR